VLSLSKDYKSVNCEIVPTGFSDGINVSSEQGRKLQERFRVELLARMEDIQPGVTLS